MMIDQGLAPLSIIYRTFGAFPRTQIKKNPFLPVGSLGALL